MEKNYSIEEILSAVDEIQKIEKIDMSKKLIDKQNIQTTSSVPKNTLKLIEEAEKFKSNKD